MVPTFKTGDLVLVSKISYFFKNPKINDIVVTKNKLIKRIVREKAGKYFLRGDDGGEVGWIIKSDIIGKVIYKL